jgi:hypothetical protein
MKQTRSVLIAAGISAYEITLQEERGDLPERTSAIPSSG